MPIFEYACSSGHRTEVIDLANSRREEIPCAQCGEVAVRVPSVSTFGGFTEPKESNVSRAIRQVKSRGL